MNLVAAPTSGNTVAHGRCTDLWPNSLLLCSGGGGWDAESTTKRHGKQETPSTTRYISRAYVLGQYVG